jgi:hypothetical protein
MFVSWLPWISRIGVRAARTAANGDAFVRSAP